MNKLQGKDNSLTFQSISEDVMDNPQVAKDSRKVGQAKELAEVLVEEDVEVNQIEEVKAIYPWS